MKIYTLANCVALMENIVPTWTIIFHISGDQRSVAKASVVRFICSG